MKMLLQLAAIAALATPTFAVAKEPASGHWEWRNRPVSGPNKSNLPPRVRVWVKHKEPATDRCDCCNQQADTKDCKPCQDCKERSESCSC